VPRRTYATSGDVSAPLIANGILYVATNRLYAFAAAGATGCSAAPATCTPLWTASTADFDGMTIAGGDIFVTDAEGVQAFDATGSDNCTGTPKVCSPLWATSTSNSTGTPFSPGPGSPVVANGVLYVPGVGDGLAPDVGGAYVAAFDASGKTGCSGTPTICVPVWTTSGVPESVGNSGSPAISGGVLYIASGSLYAFDAAGSTGCAGTPKTCAPLWTAAMPGGGPTTGAPAVADGMVYVATTYSGLYAFGAAGSTNCATGATGKTCAPLWHAPAQYSSEGTPAVANGVVYVATGGLAAFAAGAGSCPGTAAAKTCTVAPLWISATSGAAGSTSSPAVANGVVYVTGGGGIYGYDAAGSRQCPVSATAKTCSPLWSDVVGFAIGESPALVNGTLFINVPGKEAVYAFSL
jgi:PQQ-like domain